MKTSLLSSRNMAPRPVCKYYEQGRCYKGDKCKFRHNIPGFITAVDVWGVPADKKEGSITLLVDKSMRVTFEAGMVPVKIEFLLSNPAFKVQRIETAIQISWSKPTRTVEIKFNEAKAAHRAREALRRTEVEGVSLGTNFSHLASQTYLLKVSKVLEDVDMSHVLEKILEERASFACTEDDPTYALDTPDLEVLEGLITKVTKREIRGIQMLKCKNPLKYKAGFRVDDGFKLDGVAQQLNGKEVDEFAGSKIYAAEHVKVHLQLARELYPSHAGHLKSMASKIWQQHKVQVHIDEGTINDGQNRGSGGPVEITLSATSRTALSAAKCMLNADLIQTMAGNLSRALEPSKQLHQIRLTKTKAYRDAINGGLQRATDLLGSDVVYLNDKSDPPAIMVRGDTNTLRKVEKCLRGDGSLPDKKTKVCAICWDKCDEIVRHAGCGHVACKECFVGYCTVDGEAKFPLRCFESDCDRLLDMGQLRSVLGKDDFQRLTSEAVADHFNRNPSEYAQCIGADCTAYYRLCETKTRSICPTCFTIICADCKVEFHFGETCKEYQARASDHLEELEQWAESQGAKHCKNCNAIVQKLEGCNNMQCLSCKVHFCWECMEVFGTHAGVYAHLTEKHGGYWGEGREEDPEMRDILEEGALVERVRQRVDLNGNPMLDARQLARQVVQDERVLAGLQAQVRVQARAFAAQHRDALNGMNDRLREMQEMDWRI